MDDNPADLLSLRAILEDFGQNLVEAHSGPEALQRLQSDEFAMILLDVQMPGLSGFETARLIRNEVRTRHTPIIFLTAAEIDRSQLAESSSLGAMDIMVKPFLPMVLQAKVRGFIELFQEKQRVKREADLLRLLIHATTDYAIFMLDPEGFIVTWNSGAERLKGYKASEIIGQHFSRFYPQEAIDRGWPAHELRVARSEGRFEDVGWRIRQDGTQFWANVVITALHDEFGNFRGFSKITRDMTERKKAEEDARRLLQETTARRVAEENARLIQEQRERLHVTLASIGDAVISTDAQGRVDFLNAAAEELIGWKLEEATGRPLSEVFHIVSEATRQPVENPAVRVLRDGTTVGLLNHAILVARDGSERPIEDTAAPIRDTDGKVVGCVLVFRDVTLRQSAERHRNVRLAVTQALNQAATVDDGVRGVLQAVCESLGWDLGFYWTLDDDGKVLTCQQDWHRPAEPRDAFGTVGCSRTLEKGQGLPGRVWASGKSAWILDIAHDVSFPRGASAVDGNLHSAFACPIVVGDRMLGVMEFNTRHIREADDDFLEMMDTIAGNVGQFIERKAAEEELQRSEQELSDFFENAAIGLRWVGPDGTILRANRAELEMLGYSREEYVGHPIAEFQVDNESIYDVLKRLSTGEELVDFPTRMRCKDGTLKDVLINSSVLRREGHVVHTRCFTRDVTERIRMDAELRQQTAQLRDADRRKDEFLATLAHELRNPLAPIRNSLHILKMPKIDAATIERSRAMMERQVHHLVRLVDDLMDVSRVMRGKIELRRERIDLAAVVARAVETVQPLMDSQGHELSIDLPPEPLLIYADPVRLAQVVGNLLTNSAKYTEANGHIWLSAQREGDEAVLRVRDNGIGIAPEMLTQVFELFVQVDHSSSKAQGGLGIGLTLVKNLVEMHQGSVEALSKGLGEGCEFVVRLPLMTSMPQSGDNGSAQPNRAAPSSGHRLLVVDDNRDAAISLSLLLRLQGHDVRVAHDGPSALQMAMTFQPDMVFLDIGMPGMDGYEVARRLRHQPGMENVVLAALTGWGQQEDRRRTAEAGFNHHLVKPPEPKALEDLLNELTLRRR